MKSKTTLNSRSYSFCHKVRIYRLVNRLTSSVSIFVVSSPPSMTTLRFTHSSLMSISPGKTTNFPIPSLSILPSSSSNITTLSGGDLLLQRKRYFLWKYNLNVSIFAREVFCNLSHIIYLLAFVNKVFDISLASIK